MIFDGAYEIIKELLHCSKGFIFGEYFDST
jgi:hypothetical protein